MKKLIVFMLVAGIVGAMEAEVTSFVKGVKGVLSKADEGFKGFVAKADQGIKDIRGKTEPLFQKTKVYGVDTDISVEIKNKSAQKVYAFILDEDVYSESGRSRFAIEPNETRSFKPNSKDNALEIRIAVPSDTKTETEYVYTLPKGKTAYVTWDGTRLRPQTGLGAGTVGKTDTGLSLGKNVKDDEVTFQRSHKVKMAQK